MIISICVATYQRPEGLKRLVEGLDRLSFDHHPTPQIEVIVVDNDPHCSAQVFCQQLQSHFRWSLTYLSEPQRGISYVRNRAIAQIDPATEFAAFIDDDEVPESSWLEELLTVQQKYQADAVTGPSLPFFPEPDTPKWAVEGKFFEAKRFPTGHMLKFTGAGNVLLRAQVLREMGQIFDPRFAMTGGEDTHFFMRVSRAGYKIVWADAAVVHEWIPQSRIKMQWILQRGYRCHSTYALCEKEFEPIVKVLVKRIGTGTARMAIGLVTLLPAILLGRVFLVRSLLEIYRGAGMFSGLMGRSYQEYQNIHGD